MPARSRKRLLIDHVDRLSLCRRCPRMQSTPVTGGPIVSQIILVGQAPGPREPVLQKPFAWTAGKTLFQWFEKFCAVPEADIRTRIYFAAVCRCFPGKAAAGGDRVPAPGEVENCSTWLDEEIQILKPRLVIPVGRLAIKRFIDCPSLEAVVGRTFRATRSGHEFDLIPLPHPSGASPWPKIPPGKGLLQRAMRKIARHPTMIAPLSHRI
ncbi:MAG TPA: uracil-DNA glycosylase family protein [Chthoniobacterales bacterium]|jgi:uracil-DNA glycosylase